MKISLPPSEEPILKHVDENGRPKHTPPSRPEETPPLPIEENNEHSRMTNTQKQKAALRQIYDRVRKANSEQDLEDLGKLTDHIPPNERNAYTQRLANIRLGMENRRKLKRLLQVKNLNKMARSAS